MRTKLVYVVTSSDKDIYLEQFFVSSYSAKYYMPDCYIILLTDVETEKSFSEKRKQELQYADEIISINLDAKKNTAQKRSRLLKTNVRNYVKGDFLFIDCDTIIAKPLYEIDNCEYEMAACWDSHSLFKNNPYRNLCITDCKKINFNVEKEDIYFNSGVIYCKDTENTHNFYERWNKNYIEGSSKVKMDQPSFAKTNFELNHFIHKLDDVWNCELKHGIKYLKDAKVVHYLCTNKSQNNDIQLFLLNDENIIRRVKDTAEIFPEIKETIVDPFYGIAGLTHCFAGQDVFFFRTFAYRYLRSLYKNGPYGILIFFKRCINKLQSIIIKHNNL